MERSNRLISEFLLFLDVGKGLRGVGVGRGGTRREGDFCGEFFLTESDRFRLAKTTLVFRYYPRHEILVTLSFRVLSFDGADLADFFCSSVH